MKRKLVVDIIGEVVASVQTELLATLSAYDQNIVGVNYMYGPPLEIINRLTDWTKSNGQDKKKYPLVALFQPFTENYGVNTIMSTNIRLIIARRNSDPKMNTAPQRYDVNFKPVLIPVCDELIKQLGSHESVVSNGYFDMTRTEWPFWGGDEQQSANIFNDKVDIIELRINNLTIDLTC